jgi:DNA-binding NarL/FixJ family response regulator
VGVWFPSIAETLESHPMKVLIGDDHRLFRDGVKLQLQEFDENLVVIEASDFAGVVTGLHENQDLELALIDLSMPGMGWRESLHTIIKDHPSLPLVVVSATDDKNVILEALDLGIAGYIPKTSSGDVMINALRLVMAGGVYVPREVLSQSRPLPSQKAAPPEEPADSDDDMQLSPRQLEVLALIADGKSNKVIASMLGLSDGTVKTHISAILRRLNANNRTQAILNASRTGILKLS